MVSTTVIFEKDNVQPPVFVAGEFTDWEPVEMAHETSEANGSVKNVFSHKTELEPGEYQYKFRLGPGDWWVLDEFSTTATDEQGNVNNILSVTPKESQAPSEPPVKTNATPPVNVLKTEDAQIVEEEPRSHPPNGSAEQKQSAQANPAPEETGSKLEKFNTVQQSDSIVEAPKDDNERQAPLDDLKAKIAETVVSIRKNSIPDVAPPPYSASTNRTATKSEDEVQATPVKEAAPQEPSAEPKPAEAQSERKQKSFIAQFYGTRGLFMVAAMVGVPVVVSYFLRR